MEPLTLQSAIVALIILCVGFGIVFLLVRITTRFFKSRVSPHHVLIFQKIVLYLGIILVVATVLLHMGVNLTAVLGAAGIVTVAIGFAAQTSLSNLISGLFLLGERPFEVGDLILVSGTRGTVMSIDLLSVKLRTADNTFVRMPNETLIKSQVTTITRFPIRRMDIKVGVTYKEDVTTVMRVLREVVNANPNSLDEPEPLILFTDFGTSSLDFLVGAWFEKTSFLKLKNSLMRDIKERFDKEGIEFAFPHLTVYTGTDTPPFPVRMSPTPEKEGI